MKQEKLNSVDGYKAPVCMTFGVELNGAVLTGSSDFVGGDNWGETDIDPWTK